MTQLFLSLITLLFSANVPPEIAVSLSPETVDDGQTALIRLQPSAEGPLPSNVMVQAGETAITLFDCPGAAGARCGFVGIPIDTKVGPFAVTVSWGEKEEKKTKSVAIVVQKGKFQNTVLKVDPDRVHPTEEEKNRIDQEKKELEAAYAGASPIPLWRDKFQLPGKGAITSPFGNRRTFNGDLKSIHFGADMRANKKTVIHCANAGKVILAKEFFFAGNLVVVDHGAGVFSSYAHLSVVKVTPGQTVKKGERLGIAGATGRVTGPHLHWGMRVNGVPVDPHQMRTVFNSMFSSPPPN